MTVFIKKHIVFLLGVFLINAESKVGELKNQTKTKLSLMFFFWAMECPDHFLKQS